MDTNKQEIKERKKQKKALKQDIANLNNEIKAIDKELGE